MPKRTGWGREFDDPIELPGRSHTFVTLAISGCPWRTCACRKSNPEILMMQPAQYRSTIDVPYPLYGARYRRILPHG
jgi:hypothetical protein